MRPIGTTCTQIFCGWMLSLKRKSPTLDPYYRPGFMPHAKIKAMLDRAKTSPPYAPRPGSVKTPVARTVGEQSQTAASREALGKGVSERVAPWGVSRCSLTICLMIETALCFGT